MHQVVVIIIDGSDATFGKQRKFSVVKEKDSLLTTSRGYSLIMRHDVVYFV